MKLQPRHRIGERTAVHHTALGAGAKGTVLELRLRLQRLSETFYVAASDRELPQRHINWPLVVSPARCQVERLNRLDQGPEENRVREGVGRRVESGAVGVEGLK